MQFQERRIEHHLKKESMWPPFSAQTALKCSGRNVIPDVIQSDYQPFLSLIFLFSSSSIKMSTLPLSTFSAFGYSLVSAGHSFFLITFGVASSRYLWVAMLVKGDGSILLKNSHFPDKVYNNRVIIHPQVLGNSLNSPLWSFNQ